MLQHDPFNTARTDRIIDAAVLLGVGVLILVGFATSYRTLLELAIDAGGYPPWLAPAVPLSFDLGIVVLSLKVAQAARQGRHAPTLRLLVAGLSAATVLANASAATGLAPKLLHAVPPAMFVVCFESVVISVRRRALEIRGAWPTPIPRQHPLRWLLAPRTTWAAWRLGVLASTQVGAVGAVHMDREEQPEHGHVAEPSGVASGPSVDPRVAIVREVLQRDRKASAAALKATLDDHGHLVSLRTAQRLRAATAVGLDGRDCRE